MLHVVLWVLYPAQCQPFDTVCSDVAIVARLWLSVLGTVSHFPDDISSSSIMSSPPLRSPTCCDHGRVRVASTNPNNITSVIRYHQQNL
jgi:hypothetical protein